MDARLTEHLRQQLRFLRNSMAAFDAGEQYEAKRIATVLRVLFHDGGRGRSLLTQMGIRESVRWAWFGMGHPQSGTTQIISFGPSIVSIELVVSEDETRYSYSPLGPDVLKVPGMHAWVPFDEWWNAPVVPATASTRAISRWNLVEMLSNRDGGAHVDDLRDYEADLAANRLTPWFAGQDETAVELDPVPASLRTVAGEVCATVSHRREIFFPPPAATQ